MLHRVLGCVAATFVMVAAAQSQTFTDIYAFDNTPHGALAQGDLSASSNVLYGTTLEGGEGDGGGTVYSVNSDGSDYTVLHSFNYNGDTNGFGPSAGVTLSGSTLYGTTSEGGSDFYGTIFSMQTDGSHFLVLHEFNGTNDFGAPMGGMVLIGDTLYGTCHSGSIFAIHTDGSGFTNLHVFSGTDGNLPVGSLTTADEIIYGTTSSGGANGGGTVFSIYPDGSGFTNLHSFTSATEGGSPQAGVTVVGNTIFGSATYGGPETNGSVFSMNLDGTGFTPLHFFGGGTNDGSQPDGDLTVSDSTIYGTTISGGANGKGVLFSLNIDGGYYANLFSFTDASGDFPQGGALLLNNTLYGLTTEGASNEWGCIYGFHLPEFQALEIATQPASHTNVPLGISITLSVVARSSITPALEYQWRLNGVNIPGATNSDLVIPDVELTNCGVYTVAISDGESSLLSASAAVTPQATFLAGGDDVAQAITLPDGLSGLIVSENTNATAQNGETPVLEGNPPSHSIWFKWLAIADGVATFSTQGSGFDTVLGAFSNTPPANANRAGLADDDTGGYLTSLITFNVKQGSNYLIGIDGHAGASGNVALSWNDQPGPPGPVIITPPVAKTVVSNSADALFSCQSDSGNALWFKEGDPFAVGGGTDFGIPSVNDSTVGDYFAVVSSSSGSVQTEPFQVQINLLEDGTTDTNSLAYNKFLDAAANSFLQPPPQNQHVRTGGGDTRGYTVSQTFSTVGNVSEPGEPFICGQIGGAPAWYAYVAPTNGAMSVNTTGSGFNTMLAVYDGPGASFATLNNLGCGFAANSGESQPQVFVTGAAKNETFYVQVDGYHGASGVVQLNIFFGQPVIALSPPQDQYIGSLGAAASFTVAAQGTVPISYQWQLNGTNISGATNAVLNIPSVQSKDLGVYMVIVSNPVSQTNYSANLGVSAAPIITLQPLSGVVHPGATATLSVAASGSPAPVFYWKQNGASVGGLSNSLVIPNFQAANVGTYSVLASNSFGTASASNALLFLDTFQILAPSLSNGSFQMQMTGPAGSNYLIQTSTDLSNWIPLVSGFAADGILELQDTNASAHAFRFYRAVTN